MSTIKTVADSAVELGHNVKDTVEEFSRTASQKLGEVRDSTGSALHSAASTVRQGQAAVNNVAAGTASKLDATGNFVENCTTGNMIASVRNFSSNHMGQVFLAAVAVGFIAGTLLNRSGSSRA